MKLNFIFSFVLLFVINGFTQQKPKISQVVTKFGALAIDKNNGFYYGFSYDFNTRIEAENKAIDECNKKGGKCTVVLIYSGSGCAVYRTIDGKVGTAYGWGVAKNKQEADAIAIKECLSRSNGIMPNNFVWSCNSTNQSLQIIVNANEKPKKNVLDVEMIEVEGGEVTSWGIVNDKYNFEPNGKVHVNSFLIAKYEVTQGLWTKVMGTNPTLGKQCDNCAVGNVSFNEANNFIKKLNSLTGKIYRLPAEEEWDFASIGGNNSKGFIYAGSNNIDEIAWYHDNSGPNRYLMPVGLKKPNELGIYDMTGNADEWLSRAQNYNDWHEESWCYYQKSNIYSYPEYVKISDKNSTLGNYKDHDYKFPPFGIRLAMDK
jgi:formylglycine-generating enzyme required for sulfatase activity